MAAEQHSPTHTKATSDLSTARGSVRLEPHDTEGTAEIRRRRIALAAFYRAEARGFAPGGELEDWLEAEREVALLDASAAAEAGSSGSAGADTDDTPAIRRTTSGTAAKRSAPKRSKSTRAAPVQARNREDES